MTEALVLERRRWIALILLCFAQFIVVLDASIVNVALPSIGKGLHFSQRNLAWVVNAYVLTFGGFLLLGGRLADLLGRRACSSPVCCWSLPPPSSRASLSTRAS
jgi:MFS family permease